MDRKLNVKQEKFCQLYVKNREFFGNATRAYSEAYEIETTNPEDYKTANAAGARLLANVSIQDRITELLNELLRDNVVDGELAKVILQDYKLEAKVAGIREYNKLKQRIVDKSENRSEVLITGLEKLTDEQLDATLTQLKNQLGQSPGRESETHSPQSA